MLEMKKIKTVTVTIVSPSICHEVTGTDAMSFVLLKLSFKPAFSLSSLTLIKRLLVSLCFLPSWWCHLHISGYWYFSRQSWFQLVLHPAHHFAWFTLYIYSAYNLNKQGDNIQPTCTPFPIWNQSIAPCPILTVAPWAEYRFLRRQVR